MHPLLSRLLVKRGISDAAKLDNSPSSDGSKSEQQLFLDYQVILSKEELTVSDIRSFCESQIQTIESKWRDLNIRQEVKSELIPYHTVYKTLLSALESPKAARENLEKYLNSLI